MKPTRRLAALFLFCLTIPALRLAAQDTGAIEITVRVTPTGGRAEPARQLTCYLLRKSFADISAEAERAETDGEFDRFVDGLEVSKELKAWMKKHHTVELAGTQFIQKLRPDDVMGVPEFYEAYLQRNMGYDLLGFPKPKYRLSEAQKDPERYARQAEEYKRQVRKFLENNPESADGMDAHLDTLNPGQRWVQQQAEARQRVRRRALQLAGTRYLAAQAETGLDGHAQLTRIAPGEYWLSTLETPAAVGDVRLRWDVPVTVRAGATARAELSNLNAVEPPRTPR